MKRVAFDPARPDVSEYIVEKVPWEEVPWLVQIDQWLDEAYNRPRNQARDEVVLERVREFLDRSAIFLRMKEPFRSGRGFARGARFTAQDVQVWRNIQMGRVDGIGILTLINHWLDQDFSWDVLDRLLAQDRDGEFFDAIVSGDAHAIAPVRDFIDVAAVEVEYKWACQLCKEDGVPTVNSYRIPIMAYFADCVRRFLPIVARVLPIARRYEGAFSHEFCRLCQTYRYDPLVWMCEVKSGKPPPGYQPCRQVMRMSAPGLAVPCCFNCEAIRTNFEKASAENGGIFNVFANLQDDEPRDGRSVKVDR